MPNFSKHFKITIVTSTNLQLQFITHRQNFQCYHSRSLVLQPRPLLQNSVQGALIHISFWPMWIDKLEIHCVLCHWGHALTGSLCELCCASCSCPVLPFTSTAQRSLCHWIKGYSNADMASLYNPNSSAHLHINPRTPRLSLQLTARIRCYQNETWQCHRASQVPCYVHTDGTMTRTAYFSSETTNRLYIEHTIRVNIPVRKLKGNCT